MTTRAGGGQRVPDEGGGGPAMSGAPCRAVEEDVERLLNQLKADPELVSRSLGRQVAATVPWERLVEELARARFPSLQSALALVLGTTGRPEAIPTVVEIASTPLPHDRTSSVGACLALLGLGPGGREALLAIAAHASTAPRTLDALQQGMRLPAFRPAAAAALVGITTNPEVDDDSRALAAAAVVQAGWACGAEAARSVLVTRKTWPEEWTLAGCPRYQELVARIDPARWLLADYVAHAIELNRQAGRDCAEQVEVRRFRLEGHLQAHRGLLQGLCDAARGLRRNDPCYCGSGRKFKACHSAEVEDAARTLRQLEACTALRSGWSQSWFERPLPERQRAVALLAATDPGAVPPHVLESDWLRWMVADRLRMIGRGPQAVEMGLDVLERWGEDPGLDYPQVLRNLVGGVVTGHLQAFPHLLDLLVRHADAEHLFHAGVHLQNAGLINEFESLVLSVAVRRSQDVEALLAVCAAWSTEDNTRRECGRELLAEALEPFRALPRVAEALADLEAASEEVESSVPGEAGGDAEWERLRSVMRGDERLERLARLQETSRGLRRGIDELEHESLDPASREPARVECDERLRLLQRTEAELSHVREALKKGVVDVLERRPDLLALEPGDGVLWWLLPAGVDTETACIIAAAAGEFGAEADLLPGAAAPVVVECRRGRLALRQLVSEFQAMGVDLALLCVQEHFERAGMQPPPTVQIPRGVAEEMAPTQPEALLDPPESLAAMAAREGLHVLEAAARLGALHQHGGCRAVPGSDAGLQARRGFAHEPAEGRIAIAPEPETHRRTTWIEPEDFGRELEGDDPGGAPRLPRRECPPTGWKPESSWDLAALALAGPGPRGVEQELERVRVGRTTVEALRRAGDDAGDVLAIWESALESARQSRFPRPLAVHRALMAVADLGRLHFAARSEGRGTGDWGQFFRDRGIKYAAHESPTTRGLYGDERVFRNGRRAMTIWRHLTLGSNDRNNCLQIYFDIDEDHGRMAIGHCGPHLSYATQGT